MSTDNHNQDTDVEPEVDPDAVRAGAELCQMLSANPVAVLDVFISTFRLARDAAQLPTGKFHTVIVPDAGVLATVTTVNSFEEFLALWREARHQQAAQIFGFSPRGERILPSPGGDYMVTPWGRFPLYTAGNDTDVELSGRLGPVPPIPQSAPVLVPPASADDVDDEGTLPEDAEGVDDEDFDEDSEDE